jgi:hypothetical protein
MRQIITSRSGSRVSQGAQDRERDGNETGNIVAWYVDRGFGSIVDESGGRRIHSSVDSARGGGQAFRRRTANKRAAVVDGMGQQQKDKHLK